MQCMCKDLWPMRYRKVFLLVISRLIFWITNVLKIYLLLRIQFYVEEMET